MQRAVLAYVLGEPGGRSSIDGTPLATSGTGLARVVYGAGTPSDAQRAAVRRTVRRLEAGGLVEVHRLPVGRTYTRQRAHPRFLPPRYDRRLAVCTGEDGCPGCAAGDRPSTYFDAGVAAMFRMAGHADYFPGRLSGEAPARFRRLLVLPLGDRVGIRRQGCPPEARRLRVTGYRPVRAPSRPPTDAQCPSASSHRCR